jgi:hypothetical protein
MPEQVGPDETKSGVFDSNAPSVLLGDATQEEQIVATSTNRGPTPNNVDNVEAQESMAEPELLALIIELRLRDGRPATKDRDGGGSSSNSNSAKTSAVDTLDLCHRKIQVLPYEMVNIIKDDVVR